MKKAVWGGVFFGLLLSVTIFMVTRPEEPLIHKIAKDMVQIQYRGEKFTAAYVDGKIDQEVMVDISYPPSCQPTVLVDTHVVLDRRCDFTTGKLEKTSSVYFHKTDLVDEVVEELNQFESLSNQYYAAHRAEMGRS